MFLKKVMVAGALIMLGNTAMAGCGISSGNVNVLSNDFPAIQAVTAGADDPACISTPTLLHLTQSITAMLRSQTKRHFMLVVASF